jgi:hypothetical protein
MQHDAGPFLHGEIESTKCRGAGDRRLASPRKSKGRKVRWAHLPILSETPTTIPIRFSLVAVDSSHHEYGRSFLEWRSPR